MEKGKVTKKNDLSPTQRATLENMHRTFLDALRHREQEILRFIAILAPALGGFIWLLRLDLTKDNNLYVFTIGVIGVLLLLLVGALYSLALGYNYRCITFQLAKLESLCLQIREFIINSWPRSPSDFAERCQHRGKPWCDPPEIIKIFWLAFSIGTVGVTLAVMCLPLPLKSSWLMKLVVLLSGVLCLWIIMRKGRNFGQKILDACEKEGDSW